jgi:hypothetical protein
MGSSLMFRDASQLRQNRANEAEPNQAMNAEYEAIFREGVRARIIERRSKLLAAFLTTHGLPEPKSVACSPLRDCHSSRCFVNVEQQIARMGGSMETGWMFWEYADVSVHTEAHAIWVTPQAKRLDITPHKLQPNRILFTPDPRVAAKRGYTVGYRTILSSDPRVRAIESFASELEHIFAEAFEAFGREMAVPTTTFRDAAERVGLPWDVADWMVRQKQRYYNDSAAQYL